MTHIGKHAIVIGAGMGGLAATAAAAPHFERVTILERDALPSEADWRIGTPQCRHAHALLLGGLEALNQLVPGFRNDLAAAGAVPFRIPADMHYEQPGAGLVPRRDVGLPPAYSMTRPLLEHTLRRRIEALGGVTIRDQVKVQGLESVGGRATGVRLSGGETIGADLVIDSSGRGAPSLDLLRAEGLPLPEEEVLGINACYTSVIVDKPKGWVDDWSMAITIADAPHDHLGAFVFTIEDGRWMVSLNEMHGGDQPTDWQGLLALARRARTPTVYDAIKHARPVTEVVSFRRMTSTLRRFERLDAFPRGLVVFGDAICQFNPIYGQGMSVASQEALALARVLAAHAASADPLDDLAQDFFAETPVITETPWNFAKTFDLQWPEASGVRPEGYDDILRFTKAMFELSARDAAIQKLQWEVGNCLKHGSVLEEPAVADRVRALMSEPATA